MSEPFCNPQARNHLDSSSSESGKIASEVILSAPITITSMVSVDKQRGMKWRFPAAQRAHATAYSPAHKPNGKPKAWFSSSKIMQKQKHGTSHSHQAKQRAALFPFVSGITHPRPCAISPVLFARLVGSFERHLCGRVWPRDHPSCKHTRWKEARPMSPTVLTGLPPLCCNLRSQYIPPTPHTMSCLELVGCAIMGLSYSRKPCLLIRRGGENRDRKRTQQRVDS